MTSRSPPGRLLLAGDDETLVRRVRRFCGEAEQDARAEPAGLPAPAAVSHFVVPSLDAGVPPPDVMSVTDFRTYLDCPYRYALRRLLRLETVDDAATEMDALRFGSLAHKVLEAFGKDEGVRDATDAGRSSVSHH